jgi:hypothetical protein
MRFETQFHVLRGRLLCFLDDVKQDHAFPDHAENHPSYLAVGLGSTEVAHAGESNDRKEP